MQTPLSTEQLLALGGAAAKKHAVLIVTDDGKEANTHESVAKLLEKYGAIADYPSLTITLGTQKIYVRPISGLTCEGIHVDLVMKV